MRWLAPIWLAGPRFGRPGKRHALRFSRGAAIGCRHGRQPVEWSVLNAPKRQRGDTWRPARHSCCHMLETAQFARRLVTGFA